MNSVRVREPKRWARLAASIAAIEAALGSELSADVRSLVIARAFRAGVLGREDASGVRAIPGSEEAAR